MWCFVSQSQQQAQEYQQLRQLIAMLCEGEMLLKLIEILQFLTNMIRILDDEHVSAHSLLPNWAEAELHAKAVSTQRPMISEREHPVCRCCNNLIDRQPVQVCANKKGLSFLGYGIPLYFLFIKYCIVLNLLLIVTDGIVQVYTAYHANNLRCSTYFANHSALPSNYYIQLRGGGSKNQSKVIAMDQMQILCNSKFIMIASIEKGSTTSELLMRISAFFIHLLFLIYIKMALHHTGQYYNEINSDLADYSVIFRNLPVDVPRKRGIFDQIIKSLHRLDGSPMQYFDLVVVPRKDDFQKLLAAQEKTKSKYLKTKELDEEEAQKVYEEYQKIVVRIKEQVIRSKQQLNEDRIPSQNIIVIFNNQFDKTFFFEEQQQKEIRRMLGTFFGEVYASNIVIEVPPEPRQIIWHNLKHFTAKPLRILLGWSLSIGFLTLSLVAFYFINTFKANLIARTEFDLNKNTASTSAFTAVTETRIVAWTTFICIILFNKFFMGKVLHHFTDLEHHDYKENYEFSFGFKYALGMFFTTAMMTIVIEALVHHNYYTHPFGVIEEETLMFGFSAVLIPLIWFINPYQLVHQYKRWKQQGRDRVTQKEANALMADQEYSIGKRYAQIIQMMWFMYLYADLIPGGMFVIIFGLSAYYWVDKYNLLKRSSLSYNISAKLSERVSDLIDWTLFWRFFGQIIFDSQLRGGTHAYTVVLLVLSLVYILCPTRYLINAFASQDFNPNDKNVCDIWNTHFKYANYRSTNPVYARIVGEQTQKNMNKLMQKHRWSI